MKDNDMLQIGLIGCGSFAQTHMEIWSEIPDVEVVALCRRSPSALKQMQRKWKVRRGFMDYRELLKVNGLEAIDIVTPTDSHHQIALDAIKAGKHVFCEKPLALTSAQCRELLDAAEKAGIIHCTNFNERARTPVGQMKRYLDAGFVGRIYHINIWWGMSLQSSLRPDIPSWRFRSETGGGTVYELIHVFDMARFLAGEAKRLCALLKTAEPRRAFVDVPAATNVTAPDSSAFILEFESGAYAVIHTSFVTRGLGPDGETSARVEVSGETGRIIASGHEGLKGISGAQGQLEPLEPGEPYPRPYERFVEVVHRGGPLYTTFYEGLKAAELVDAASLSDRDKRWVELAEVAAGRYVNRSV